MLISAFPTMLVSVKVLSLVLLLFVGMLLSVQGVGVTLLSTYYCVCWLFACFECFNVTLMPDVWFCSIYLGKSIVCTVWPLVFMGEV